MAANYRSVFEPPFVGCAKYSDLAYSQGSPYVNPDYQTTKTTYCVVQRDSNTEMTGYIKTKGPGKISFTKQSGYKNSQWYRMVSYPSYTDFLIYTVSGTWMP